MNHYTKAKARYEQDKANACIAAGALRGPLGIDFRVAEISRNALDAIQHQWGESYFDWDGINQTYRGIDAFKFAIWVGDALCGLALATTGDKNVTFRFLEGSPKVDCPLKGRRILIALEAVANYGQMRGKRVLTLEPINEKLISLYENDFGFQVVRPPKGPPYCTKGI